MFSTVKSCKLLVFLGLALCLLLPGAPAFADTPMPPSQESSQCALVEPLGYTDDVVDTYWSYSCPRGVSGHSISMFNISYKTISYRNGYRRSAHHRESRLAAMCSCGVLGTTDARKGRAFCSAPLFRLDEVKVGDEYAQNLEGDL